MDTLPPLTRDIGQTERALRALLEQQLSAADSSFPHWTVLVFVSSGNALTRADLVKKQLEGHVVPSAAAAHETLDSLLSSGFLAISTRAASGTQSSNAQLALTAVGESTFLPLRQSISQITGGLYGDLPQADLEATHRTLGEIARRANALSTSTNSSTQ